METRTRTLLAAGACIAILALAPSPGRADAALAGKAGTLGVGVELTAGISRQVNARFGLNGFTYSERREASDIEYDAEANLQTATALLDFHPGGRGFRLTGGLVYNNTEIEGESIEPASGFYEIGRFQVPVELVGSLDATVDFDPVVPYAGLGWGNAVGGDGGWSFAFDLGVIFQGEADATLTPVIPADSPINTIPGLRELLDVELAREERELEEEAADYDLYPVLSIGVSYKF